MGDLQAGDPETIGPYRLLGRIGAGGMGVVYLAEAQDGSRVAVKVIRTELAGGGTFRRRFAREVEAARRVRSPVTVAVLDADSDAAVPWVAFEYVVGPNLEEVVWTRLPRVSAAVGILSGIAEALSAIHEVGLVHRDLKPSNVLCPPDGVKVIDFGIAAATDLSSLTGTGGLIGTPAWLAPEQIKGDDVSPATDVFAWGCIAVFVLTGHLAFGRDRDPPAALLYQIAYGDPNLDGVPDAWRGLVSAAVAKRPEERPTVSRLLQELLPNDLRTPPLAAPDRSATDTRSDAALAVTFLETKVETKVETNVDTAVDEAPPSQALAGSPRRRRAILVVIAVAAVAGVAAVALVAESGSGGGGRPPPPAAATTASGTRATVSLADFGQQYLDIVAPANQAIATFSSTASTLPSSTTGADYENLAAGAVSALGAAMQALLRVAWPGPVEADVRALVAADSQMATDLQNARLGSYADAVRQFEQDVGRTELAGSTVRADLGLPPPKG